MTDIAKTKEEMEYALQTGWDRDAAIRHGLEAINQLEDIIGNMKYEQITRKDWDHGD
jgi:hypothetical protein